MSTPALTRRSALGGLLAAIGLSACDLTAPVAEPPTPTPRPGGEAAPEPPVDPDVELVDGVRDDLATALALVTAAGRGRPGLARELGGLRRLHRAHLRELPGDPDPARRQRLSGGSARVRTRVRAVEARLQGTLADAAVRAESGPLAALLASMSAAVAQQLAATTGSPE